MKIIALVIFIAVYALLLLLPKYRALVAMTAAVIFMAMGIVPATEAGNIVDWTC